MADEKQVADIATLQTQMENVLKLIEDGFRRNDNTMAEIRAGQKEHEQNDIDRHEEAITVATNGDKEIIQGLDAYKIYVSSTYVKKDRLKTVGGTIGVIRTLAMAILVDRPKMIGGK